MKLYDSAVKQARHNYFASIVSNHKNNPKVLFSSVDHLINPGFSKDRSPSTDSACEEFADLFWSKNDSIRSSILFNLSTMLNKVEALLIPEETLDSFVVVDAKMFGGVFPQVNRTTCPLHPIPTSLFKTFYGSFEGGFLNTVNCCLQMGAFPAAFETAVVRPLLKKSSLDPDIFNDYRPVLNLPFSSKIFEKLVFIQLNDFCFFK